MSDLFNYQTHRRSQLTTLLCQLRRRRGRPTPNVRTVGANVLGMVLSTTASAQQQASVEIIEICRVMLYQGVLINNASTCCADSTGRCILSVHDQFGGRYVLGTVFL